MSTNVNDSLDSFINACENNIIHINKSITDVVYSKLKTALEADAGTKKIQEIEDAFPDDEIAKKVAYMIATSHEYKDKPNFEAGIKFAKNYKWKECNMPLNKLEGINKPVIKAKVFEIAKSLNPEDGNKWPLIVVDKIHGIYPQSPNKKILFDGHHRKEALEFRDMKETPVYYGVYTGDSEKSIDELIDDSSSAEESFWINGEPGLDIACEGINIDTAKMIRDEDVKRARKLLKDAKKLGKKKNVDSINEAISNLREAKALIIGMKRKIDDTPEAMGIWSKIKSALTPIFTTLPSEELDSVTPGMYYGGNGGYGATMTFNYKVYTDDMSEGTSSSVKRRLQEILNLFLHNLDKTIASFEKEKKRLERKPATESDIEEALGVSLEGFLSKLRNVFKGSNNFSKEEFNKLKEKYTNLSIDQLVDMYVKDIRSVSGLKLAGYDDPNVSSAAEIIIEAMKRKNESYKLFEKNNCPIIYDKERDKLYCWMYIRGQKGAQCISDTVSGVINSIARENAKQGKTAMETHLLNITAEATTVDMKANEADSYIFTEDDEVILESVFARALEATLTAEQRRNLPDNAFGLPDKRKYPLYLESKEESINHIKQAMRFFMYCPNGDRKELAQNIKKAAVKYGIQIPDTSLIKKYI